MPILEVNHLSISFTRYGKGLRQQTMKVVDDLRVSVNPGEVLAIVGSSGAGKSLLAHAIMGLLPSHAKVTGMIRFNGEALTPRKQMRLRGREMALVPQSVHYLNPLMKVGAQVRSAVRGGHPLLKQRKAFERYGLAPKVEGMYPFQISGGMARRVLVSTATVSDAQLVIADEPTSGLHSGAIKETLKSLRDLANHGCAVMMITHDIQSALTVADKVAVFKDGTIVETVDAGAFTGTGQLLSHPYSKALWRALPQNDFIPPHTSKENGAFALEGKRLGFRYQSDQWVFKDIDIQVHSGEVVGLMGPSGCGKTTLARVLSGIDQPDEGSVLFNRAALPSSGYRPVQLVYQHPELAVNPRWPLQRILCEGWQPDDRLLASLGIKQEWLKKYPNECSSGELQRICVARALSPMTRILIADEMTSMLDAVAQAQIWKAVLDIVAEREMGILVISHDEHLIKRLCNRVIDISKTTKG